MKWSAGDSGRPGTLLLSSRQVPGLKTVSATRRQNADAPGVLVLEADRPRVVVTRQDVDCEHAAHASTAGGRGYPEADDRTTVVIESVHQRERDGCVLAGLRMEPPGQVRRPVGGGVGVQRGGLVAAVAVGQPQALLTPGASCIYRVRRSSDKHRPGLRTVQDAPDVPGAQSFEMPPDRTVITGSSADLCPRVLRRCRHGAGAATQEASSAAQPDGLGRRPPR